MNKYKLLLTAVIAFSIQSLASAQITIMDDFSSSANWSSPSSFGSGLLEISGGRVNYTSSGVAPNRGSYIKLIPSTFSYTSDWEAQVDVHAKAASNVNFDYFYGYLSVFRTGDAFFQNNNLDQPLFTSMSADIIRPGGIANGFQLTYSIAEVDWFELPITNPIGKGVPNGTTDGAIRISFDASTKTLTAFYDDNGAIGGYSWTKTASIDVDGAEDFGMTNSDTFTINLSVNSGLDVFVNGDMYFDNFSVTAIPEPSTYAGLLGFGALGFVVYSRRIRKSE